MLPYRLPLHKSAPHISGTMRGLKGKRMETDPPWLDLTIDDVLSPPTPAVRTALLRLVEAVLARDHLATGTFHQLVGSMVKSQVSKRAQSLILRKDVLYSAEELDQDVWLFLFTGSRSTSKDRTQQDSTPTKSPLLAWNGESPFGYFISGCVYHFLVDQYRKSLREYTQRLYHHSGDSLDKMADDKTISPEKRSLLRRCWEQLDPFDREILELVMCVVSQAEIAKKLGVSGHCSKDPGSCVSHARLV